MARVFFGVICFLLLCSCGSSEEEYHDSDSLLTDKPISPKTTFRTPPDCGDHFAIEAIPVLDGTTFPFDCTPTASSNNFVSKDASCMQQQFLNLRESFKPNRKRDWRRDDGSATRYPYYPETHVSLSQGNGYWYVMTEYGVDELVQPMDGGLTYTDGRGRAYHPGEDWNLSSGDNLEHLYSIGRGIVVFKDVAYGNTVQILHKVCPYRDPTHSECEFLLSFYGHLSDTDRSQIPDVGTYIEKGAYIGRLGTTGTGFNHPHDGTTHYHPAYHLHLEIRRGKEFLKRFNTQGQVDPNGPCIGRNEYKNTGTRNTTADGYTNGFWPPFSLGNGRAVSFIRENYYDPTEFIKTHTGILLHQRYYQFAPGTNVSPPSVQIVLPQAGIVVADLFFPLGTAIGDSTDTKNQFQLYNVGATDFALEVRNDDNDRSLRLTGNIRQLAEMRGDQRVVVWGERDRPTQAGWIYHIQPVIRDSRGDEINTPYHLRVVLYPYDVETVVNMTRAPFSTSLENMLAKHNPIPRRPIYFDGEEIQQNAWYDRDGVQYVYDKGAVGGYGASSGFSACPTMKGKFCPANPISRAEFFGILMNAINATYHDRYVMPQGLAGNEWYAKTIATAFDWRILWMQEIDDNRNGSLEASELQRNVSRAETARYIVRAFRFVSPFGMTVANPFCDLSPTHPDYNSIIVAYLPAGLRPTQRGGGMVTGYQKHPDMGSTCPQSGQKFFVVDRAVLRGEMATMLAKAIRIRLDTYMQD